MEEGVVLTALTGTPSTQQAADAGWNPLKWLKKQAKLLKREVLAMYYAIDDPETPFLCKVIPFFVLAYALSPLDLIPDFIPVLGIIDDLLLLPALIWLAIWLLPSKVMERARERAQHEPMTLQKNWPVAVLIYLLWLASLEWLAWYLCMRFGSANVQQWTVPGMIAMGTVLSACFVWWLVHTMRRAKAKAQAKDALLQAEGLEDPLLPGGQV